MDIEILKRVYSAHVRLHIENSVQAWSPHLLEDKFKKVERRATKSVRSLKDYSK